VARKLAIPLALALVALVVPATASAGMVAPPATCPGQSASRASAKAQEQTMLCMVNYARQQVGEAALEPNATLAESARDKSRDIFRCESFSHYACGREFGYWMRETGYISSQCWRIGENLAWGTGSYGTVRSIFRAWMHSPEHRANILGEYLQTGIDLRTGTLDGVSGTRVWAEHFGSNC
jgi:uncharacterized protein YkwD